MAISGNPTSVRHLYMMKVGESGFSHPGCLILGEKKQWYVNVEGDVSDILVKRAKLIVPVQRYGVGGGQYNFNLKGIDWFYYVDLHPTYQNINSGYCADDDDEDKEELHSIVRLDDKKLWTPEDDDTYPSIDSLVNSEASKVSNHCYEVDSKKYPKTYGLRVQLNVALEKENYERAAELREEIKVLGEPLGEARINNLRHRRNLESK